METIQWNFILIVITFLVIGLICAFKRFKAGIMAASTGIVATLSAWCLRELNIKIKSFFGEVGLEFKEILGFVICIVVTIIVFFILALVMDICSRKKRRR